IFFFLDNGTLNNNLMKRFFILMPLILIAGNTLTEKTYHSNFPNTENPISEGGHWINGGTAGLDWGNVLTTPGKVFGDQTPGSPPYKDPTAILTGSWGADQAAEELFIALIPMPC